MHICYICVTAFFVMLSPCRYRGWLLAVIVYMWVGSACVSKFYKLYTCAHQPCHHLTCHCQCIPSSKLAKSSQHPCPSKMAYVEDLTDPDLDPFSVYLRNLQQHVQHQDVAIMCSELVGCSKESQGANFANRIALHVLIKHMWELWWYTTVCVYETSV